MGLKIGGLFLHSIGMTLHTNKGKTLGTVVFKIFNSRPWVGSLNPKLTLTIKQMQQSTGTPYQKIITIFHIFIVGNSVNTSLRAKDRLQPLVFSMASDRWTAQLTLPALLAKGQATGILAATTADQTRQLPARKCILQKTRVRCQYPHTRRPTTIRDFSYYRSILSINRKELWRKTEYIKSKK